MRQLLCLVGVLCFCTTVVANSDSTAHIRSYAAGGINTTGPSWSYNFHGTFVIKSGWGLTLGHRMMKGVAPGTPGDYKSEGICVTGYCVPRDEYFTTYFGVVKEFPSKYKRLRWGAELSASYSDMRFPQFTPRTNTGIFGSNYYTTYNRGESVGAMARVKLDYSILKFVGLQLGVFMHANNRATLFGIDLSVTAGYLRKN